MFVLANTTKNVVHLQRTELRLCDNSNLVSYQDTRQNQRPTVDSLLREKGTCSQLYWCVATISSFVNGGIWDHKTHFRGDDSQIYCKVLSPGWGAQTGRVGESWWPGFLFCTFPFLRLGELCYWPVTHWTCLPAHQTHVCPFSCHFNGAPWICWHPSP